MSVVRSIEVIGTSKEGFDDAIKSGLERANKTLRGIEEIEIISQKVNIDNGKIKDYEIRMKIKFVLED
jgi:hypothetical protein